MENRRPPRVKYLTAKRSGLVNGCPSFHHTGSVVGMRKLFYGQRALLVRCGSWIYNVSEKPEVYHRIAK